MSNPNVKTRAKVAGVAAVLSCGLLFLSCGTRSGIAAGQEQNAAAPPAVSVPVSQARIAVVDGGNQSARRSQFDFGSVRTGEKITHTFTLRNEGPGVVVLDHAQPACDCTTVILMDHLGQGQPRLEPGQTAQIRVTLDTAKIEPSEIATLEGSLLTKSIWVYTAGEPDHPAIVLDMVGHVTQGVTFDPPSLAFGVVPEDRGGSRTLRVVYDRDRYSAGKTILVTSDPRLRLILASTRTLTGGKIEQQYQATIRQHAPVGIVSGAIVVTGISMGKNTPAAFTIPFAGEITGAVRPEPQQAVFGTVPDRDPVGKPLAASDIERRRIRWILLVSEKADGATGGAVWKGAQVKVDAPWVRAVLISPTGPDAKPGLMTPPDLSARHVAPGSVRWVRVELLPTAKKHVWLSGNVTVTLASGERIILPVTGEID